MATPQCPTRAQLADFVIGNLSGPELTEIAGHVERCAACEAVLQALDGQPDALVSGLQKLPAAVACGADFVPPALLAVARSARAKKDAAWLEGGERRRLGKFELLEELGAGSFGYVFRARDIELDRLVAVKILRAGRLACAEDVDRFQREARNTAQLKHPGIVAVYGTGQTEDGACYLVEEFLEGQTLAQRMSADRLEFHESAELLAAVADALHYAHEQGVVHRDLKPSNIMLERAGAGSQESGVKSQESGDRGQEAGVRNQESGARSQASGTPDSCPLTPDPCSLTPKLMDFGLAKRDADEPPMTLDGQVLGTPAYMSPEQARGESNQVDARSDVYSLGVILYELLTGERPFGGTRRMLILQVLEDEPHAPRQLNDQVPRALETICLKAMAKAPARRYSTARELADDLRRYVQGRPIHARPIGRLERLGRWCQRNPVAASLLVAVTLGSCVGLWHLSSLSEHFVHGTALTGAGQQAEVFEVFNDHYSKVVERLTRRGIAVTNDDEHHPDAVLLPASMTIAVGKEISEYGKSGMQIRLYSDHPFRSRRDGGPTDEFEWQALHYLREHATGTYFRFEQSGGSQVLRYAVPRRMKASCIECHNTHADSTKRDWQVGDVRGVLAITRPLDGDIAQSRAGLRGSFVLMAVTSAALLALSGLVLVVGNRRRRRDKEPPSNRAQAAGNPDAGNPA